MFGVALPGTLTVRRPCGGGCDPDAKDGFTMRIVVEATTSLEQHEHVCTLRLKAPYAHVEQHRHRSDAVAQRERLWQPR
jgi:hypothetical protein